MVTGAPAADHHANGVARRASSIRRWALPTFAGAAAVSLGDALLLERSKGFFTGGFLSTDHIESAGQGAVFVLLSLLIDAAVIGVIAAAAAWLLGWTRLTRRARTFAGVIVGAGSLIAADVVSYELVRYLGDSFDVALMFDLAGRSVGEILAVASEHLIVPSLLLATVVLAGAGAIWIAHRASSRQREAPLPLRTLVLPFALAAGASVALVIASGASDTLENGLLRKPSGRILGSIINAVTDVDRDGYGVVGRSADPNPLNGSIYPFALDIPGNGIDEDGVGGDLPEMRGADVEAAPPHTAWARRPDVVLVVLESFRADLVGRRENGVAVTPVMNALAAHGASVHAAYSHNGYTVQSRYHLLSGRLSNAGPDRTTLIDDFKANGYAVGYISAQDESFGGSQYDVGFARADTAYDARNDKPLRMFTSTTAGSLVVPLGVVERHAREFLDAHGSGSQPLFLYVNFQDTHFPYSHAGIQTITSPTRLPRGSIEPSARAALWATYTNTSANVDRAIGEVLDAVRAVRGRTPGVIVTSDHGESLFDEGFLGHGYELNDVQTRVPLIAANLPVALPEPFAQTDLRGAINTALSAAGSGGSTPTVHRHADRPVFQYLGDLSRPRQVAFLQNGSRLIYDFRSARVQGRDGAWRRPGDLRDNEQAEFVALIRRWERLRLEGRHTTAPRN